MAGAPLVKQADDPLIKRLASLNEQQRQVVESEGNILVCAGPGSGKTHTVTTKVAYTLSRHPSARILMTTFSRDAAREMRERVGKLVPAAYQRQLTIGTFHALCLQQLRGHGPVGRILSAIETRHMIELAIADVGIELTPEDADGLIAHCKSSHEFALANPELAEVTACYQRRVEAAGGCDFTDLLLRSIRLMESGDLAPIPATHVLADEYQDIDYVQFRWLTYHLANAQSATAVGDDDQAIYGFRRSMGYEGMRLFSEYVGGEVICLSTNYRSTDGIVGAASRLIAFNQDRIAKNITAARGHGATPRVIEVGVLEDQAERIVHELDRICANNPPPKVEPGVPPYRFTVKDKQAAVLARSNQQLQDIERVFARMRVPYVRVGRSIWDAPAVQVYLALLDAIDKQTGMGLEIALRWAKVSSGEVRALQEASDGDLAAWMESGEDRLLPTTVGQVARDLLEKCRMCAESKGKESHAEDTIYRLGAWMQKVLNRGYSRPLDLETMLSGEAPVSREAERVALAQEILGGRSGSLRARIARPESKKDDALPRVVLMTFHGSKGLEWEHCFLTDVVEGSVPKLDELPSAAAVEEERRIFYVAMTRARDHLYLLVKKRKTPSRFIAEAGLEIEPCEEQETDDVDEDEC